MSLSRVAGHHTRSGYAELLNLMRDDLLNSLAPLENALQSRILQQEGLAASE
jgi:hypothetical protein